MKNAVFIGEWKGTAGNVYYPSVREKLRGFLNFETDSVISKGELEEYKDILSRAEYAFCTWGMAKFTRDEIREYLPSLKAVFYAAGSVQGFAREFLEEGVEVFSAWAANAVPVAEYTFAQITLATKGFFQKLHRQHNGAEWNERRIPVSFPGNYECKVGIVGAGMIGRMVIDKLKTLDLIDILVYDPFLSDERASELGVKTVSLEELFAECDVISNHVANNPQTVGLMNKKHFDLMKPHAAFINTGRGAQVVEADMIEALREVPTRVAVLDVTDPEPPLADSPLYTLDNVFLTPHIAGSMGNEVHRMAEFMCAECKAYDAGEPTKYSVSLKMLETMA